MQRTRPNSYSNTRISLRLKLENYKTIYRFFIFLYNVYCNLTGFAHVLPDFYIIGAAKSGTSSLYDYLIQHKEIHSAATKEPRFFDKYYNRGINYYRVGFPLKIQKFFDVYLRKKKFLTGESTVRYLDHPYVPNRIKDVTPNAKFIVLLRNPIDRAFSHYTMMAHKNKENLSFEKAIDLENQRVEEEFNHMKKDQNYYSSKYYHHAYLDRGIYIKKLEHWLKFFPKEQFLIIQSEDFFQNPNEVYQKILQFLEIQNWQLREYNVVGPGKYKKSRLEENTRKKLKQFFKPYNEQLFDFLGIRYDWND